jgi:hypothetical protein
MRRGLRNRTAENDNKRTNHGNPTFTRVRHPSKVRAPDDFYLDTLGRMPLPRHRPLGFFFGAFHAKVKTIFILIAFRNVHFNGIPQFRHQTCERKSDAGICESFVFHGCLFVCHTFLKASPMPTFKTIDFLRRRISTIKTLIKITGLRIGEKER